jgi:N-methylhydantoinase A/oxoprolinase/acetone carboxylase beta subunit
MVDVNTIGAGGGSIAWIDGAGGLRVGRSARAPIPARLLRARRAAGDGDDANLLLATSIRRASRAGS